MVDLDPEIWKNPTLGAAATNGFLDEIQAQEIENAAAKREGREPWIAVRLNSHPGAEVKLESSYDDGMRMIDPGTLLDAALEDEVLEDVTPPIEEPPVEEPPVESK